MIVFTGPLYVYGEPCQWSGTAPETPATTVDELVAALSAQALRDATEPVDITVDGYTGKSITLHVPDDAAFSAGEFTDCDQGYFGSYTTPGLVAPERYHQGPGQIDELWILDVDGVLTVIDTGYYAGTPAEHVEEGHRRIDHVRVAVAIRTHTDARAAPQGRPRTESYQRSSWTSASSGLRPPRLLGALSCEGSAG